MCILPKKPGIYAKQIAAAIADRTERLEKAIERFRSGMNHSAIHTRIIRLRDELAELEELGRRYA